MTKSNRPMVRIHNIETDEIIDREMNDDEFAEYEAQVEVLANLKAEAETKATERQEILDRLGLTADEAKLLLG